MSINYEQISIVISSLKKNQNITGIVIIEARKGFVIDSWLSDKFKHIEQELAVFIIDANKIKEISKALRLGIITQQTYFFNNEYFLLINEITQTDFILCVLASGLVSEVRYKIKEQLDSLLATK